jgi:hypothetical protein
MRTGQPGQDLRQSLKIPVRELELPQRIARFPEFLERFQQETDLDTSTIGRISPPWTYQLLAVLCAAMLLGELAWGISCARGN